MLLSDPEHFFSWLKAQGGCLFARKSSHFCPLAAYLKAHNGDLDCHVGFTFYTVGSVRVVLPDWASDFRLVVDTKMSKDTKRFVKATEILERLAELEKEREQIGVQ